MVITQNALLEFGLQFFFLKVAYLNFHSCTYEEIRRYEKFRLSMESDKSYMFEFQSTCESAFTKGFCGHIFFVNIIGMIRSSPSLRVAGIIP